jgi:hypothetical protein
MCLQPGIPRRWDALGPCLIPPNGEVFILHTAAAAQRELRPPDYATSSGIWQYSQRFAARRLTKRWVSASMLRRMSCGPSKLDLSQ